MLTTKSEKLLRTSGLFAVVRTCDDLGSGASAFMGWSAEVSKTKGKKKSNK